MDSYGACSVLDLGRHRELGSYSELQRASELAESYGEAVCGELVCRELAMGS